MANEQQAKRIWHNAEESGQTNSNTRTIPEWQQPKLNKTGRKQEPNQALIYHNSMRVPCIFYDS